MSKSDIEITGLEYIEFYVGNVYQSAHFYAHVLGFAPVAYAGLETQLKDRVSILLECGKMRIILTSPLSSNSMIAKQINTHGDGIKDIAFSCKNASQTFAKIVKRGGALLPDLSPKDPNHDTLKGTFATFGDTQHSVIEKTSSQAFYPFFRPCPFQIPARDAALKEVDHIAVCVEHGTLLKWSQFYQNTFGFCESHKENVYTETSGMESIVVRNTSPGCVFPLVSPASHKKKSQIQEFLTFYGGAGAQHIAFRTDNIFKTVHLLKQRGLQFISVPDSYYELLEKRITNLNFKIEDLKQCGVLIDQDDTGVLLQIFSKPLQTRPTFFIEIIQREGSLGFGGGNIKALFEAIEREQLSRGTL